MGNKTINKDNLGFLGVDFQYKLIKAFVEEPGFFKELYPIVNQNVFSEPLMRTFVGTLKDYFKEWDACPTYETIKMLLNSKASTQIDVEQNESFVSHLKEKSTEGIETVKELAVKFFRQQNLIRVSKTILDIAREGDIERYDECQKLFDDAAAIGEEDDDGKSIFDLLDEAVSPDSVVAIPTGVSKLDELLAGGGLNKGKVGLLIGSAGFGKTTFSTCVASNAATCRLPQNDYEGFKVLQIYFEDDDVDITRKHFSKLTQVEARMIIKDKEVGQQIKEQLLNYKDRELLTKNLRIKRFNTGTKSASDIEKYIKKLRNRGFSPDLVIIDYFECLVPERTAYNQEKDYTRDAITMRRIENMAKNLNIAIWIPTQGNRGSVTSTDVVTMDQVGGSFTKTQICQVVISIARSLDDVDKNKATLAVLKNRNGKSGAIFEGIRYDNGTATISCDEVETFDTAMTYFEKADEVEARHHRELMDLAKQIRQKNDAEEFKSDVF